jgi:hypothetical protein
MINFVWIRLYKYHLKGDMKYLLRKVWHGLNCRIFENNGTSNLRMYTTSLKKSKIINGNKGDTKPEFDDNVSASNTMTTTYV